MSEPVIKKTPAEMAAWSREMLKAGRSLGFVPTMGALHKGHLSLIERARDENEAVAVSIYVNPTQFGPGEDFSAYPRVFEQDKALCARAGVDCIFAPGDEEMYGAEARTWVEVGGLGNNLCGLSRPGHFRGVCTVVTKLLSIVRPERAYFGQKDAQQLRIIEVLARDLHLGCEIVACPIVREADGLAVSSRNKYLSPKERKRAVWLHKALEHAERRVAEGEREALKVAGEMAEMIERQAQGEIDYISFVNAKDMSDLKTLSGEVLAALAVKIGRTRLIDNTRFSLPEEKAAASKAKGEA